MSVVDPEGPLDAALLFRQTGVLVAGWTRNPVPHDVLTVMAATMFASVQMFVEALGDPIAPSAVVETNVRRLFVTKFGSHDALILVAPKSVGHGILRQVAQKIARVEAARTSRGQRSRASIVVKE